jgi:hypothetical protein
MRCEESVKLNTLTLKAVTPADNRHAFAVCSFALAAH